MSIPTIQAIETRYAGHRFRSRLEARWAVCFDRLGLTWHYEPQGVKIADARYLPDFYLDGPICSAQSLFAEVKGMLMADDLRKILPLAEAGSPVVVLGDIPKAGVGGPHFHLFRRRPTTGQGVDVHKVSFYPTAGAGWSLQPFGFPLAIGDITDDRMIKTLPDVLADREIGRRSGWMDVPPEVEQAFRAARSARFEFGESG